MWLNIPRDLFVGSALVILEIVWVLLPLVPAIIIYRMFPGTPVFTSGQILPNLTVRAGGAFAAYLIIFLVMIPLTNKTYDTIHGFEIPYWTVHGTAQILAKDKTNKTKVMDETVLKRVTLNTRPDHFNHDTFTFDIPVAEEIGGRFPRLIVGIDENWQTSIDLNEEREENSLKRDDKFNKEIYLKNPIIIQQRLTSSDSPAGMDFGSRDSGSPPHTNAQ